MAYYGIPTKAIHEQWLGLVQPVGLVVAPAVLTKLELVPNQSTAYITALQLQLKGLLEKVDGLDGDPVMVISSFQQLATELLDWGEDDLQGVEALVADRGPESVPEVVLSEYGETLRFTHGVPKLEGEGLQALVLDLTQWRDTSGTLTPQWGRDLDAAWNPTGNGWDATPQQRFERLLKETEHPIGLLFNGTQLRLVHAPRGESSGHITLPLEPMAEVAGRPMLGALELLLGVDRLFGGNPEQRLPALLAASRKNQNEVSTRLAEQVLEALWELLLGFDSAERLAQQSGRTVLGALPTTEEGQKHLYGGLITVLLRLVFLLYAEDEALMPADSLYGQHYSVSALADRLRQERFEHQSGMADRRGGWASLLSLFRLVYDGGGADPNYLPARHGELFDPDAYPFLEGRGADSGYDDGILDNLPALSDDVVEKVLSKLIWLDGERLSYRALDVEQIGSVYEGIMGFTVEQAQGPSVGITYRPSRQKITITVVVDAEQLLAQPAGKREKWLDDQTGVALKLPAKVKKDLKDATTLAELCVALDKKLSPHTPNSLPAGSLILQPTAERRRSGSHYTPRALTEPIVAEAFRPWLERCNHKPTAEQILALKVCDPAMGSGAFLVAVCRFLAGWLVEAWERHGYPDAFREEWDKDNYARRLIAQRCLYGVDKNPFAVNLAKLSLWLVTLNQDLPFTFVDHALKCGDSLVGEERKTIEAELKAASKQREIWEGRLQQLREREKVDYALFHIDSRNDADDARKREALRDLQKSTAFLRTTGDLIVAAFFNGSKPRDREELRKIYLAETVTAATASELEAVMEEPLERLRGGEKGIKPLHWQLEFPDVFSRPEPGFDVFVGNPPFAGHYALSLGNHLQYPEYLRTRFTSTSGKCDLVAFFFRAAFSLLRSNGCFGLIATNTIAQGDTRNSGLTKLCQSGGEIFAARKRVPWPGEAAVQVSVVCICKGNAQIEPILDGLVVGRISSYLKEFPIDEDPKQICGNREFTSYQGCVLRGGGFLFDDSNEAASPIALRANIINNDPRYKSILPQIISVDHFYDDIMPEPKYAVYFSNWEREIAEKWPLAFDILANKVQDYRSSLTAKSATGQASEKWWQFNYPSSKLHEFLEKNGSIFCIAKTSSTFALSKVESGNIISQSLIGFTTSNWRAFSFLQSRTHEIWTRFFSSSLEDRQRYTPSDCFDTYPFPPDWEMSVSLETAGREYYEYRAALMVRNGEGLTKTYNRFHNPSETSTGLLELRSLHSEMDRAVLEAYGWSDVLQVGPCNRSCGFGLDSIDPDEEAEFPDELEELIASGELFFWEADEACIFEAQLRATGAVPGKKKLPWRYRWPDAVRDDVLARLLALNAERYQEEVDQGLHGGGRRGGGGSPGGSGTGRRRGRPPKTPPPESGQTAQIGLAL
jgi:hypothetical protein